MARAEPVATVASSPAQVFQTNSNAAGLGRGRGSARGNSTQSPRAAVFPDSSMTAEQVTPVMTLLRTKLGWYQGCLYNQEIGKTPQLIFHHMTKTGDAYELARHPSPVWR